MNHHERRAEETLRRQQSRLAPVGTGHASRLTTPWLREMRALLGLSLPPRPAVPARSEQIPQSAIRNPQSARPLATLAEACPALANLRLA